VFIPQWQTQLLEDGSRIRRRKGRMSTSEIMTVVNGFHMSHCNYVRLFHIIKG
jgi:hypothetical protein